jgi:hypothetical protein
MKTAIITAGMEPNNPMFQKNKNQKSQGNAKIVQLADETQTLPDGSKVIYAENDDKIVLYHKVPFEKGVTYIYDRTSGDIFVNNKKGTNKDKLKMVQLGNYLVTNVKEDDLITISVHSKEGNK